jgi:DNA-binding NarL/FixJ family response regulator
MELALNTPHLDQALVQCTALLSGKRVVLAIGNRLALTSTVLSAPIQPVCVGGATTEEEAFALVQRQFPDLLIVSEELESGYGIRLLQRVRERWPHMAQLIFLSRETQLVVQEALDAGANGVMFISSLGSGDGDFMQALRTIAAGGVYLPAALQRLLAADRLNLPPLVEPLSPREHQVVAAVARGLTNVEIGDAMEISHETVKTHVANAMDKLAVRDRTQLAVMALLRGLIDPLPLPG